LNKVLAVKKKERHGRGRTPVGHNAVIMATMNENTPHGPEMLLQRGEDIGL
jgi:hypothetical protein